MSSHMHQNCNHSRQELQVGAAQCTTQINPISKLRTDAFCLCLLIAHCGRSMLAWPVIYFLPSYLQKNMTLTREKVHSFITIRRPNSKEEIHFITWWQRLLQFFSLFLICDDQGIQISATTHLELYIVFILLDLNSYDIKTSGLSLCIDYTKEPA
ncbi:hypothetical protein E2320_015940 [Naja naja]|nr:hypothetical protein E2320_015940 [Naja naja]